jgi:iron transport multicopper oxidase
VRLGLIRCSGPIIVHDSKAPFAKNIDGDFTITLSDWYDNQAPGLINYFTSKTNEDDGGSEPIPDSTLMQDTQNPKFPVQPGKTYLVRIINIGGFVGQYFTFDDHEMTIVEIDGVYTQPQTTSQIYITVAQRYAVLITAQKTARKNYAIMAQMDSGMFDHVPPNVNINSAGFLVYDDTKPLPKVTPISKLNPTNDMKLVPYDKAPALSIDQQIKMDFVFHNLSNSNRYDPQYV